MNIQNPPVQTKLEELPRKRVDTLSILTIVLALALSIIIAFTVKELGLIAVLVIPATLIFISAVGQPEVGLVGFLIITYTQLSNVGIKFHGLPSIAQPLAALLFVVIIIRIAVYGERPLGWIRAGVFLTIYAITWMFSLLHAGDSQAASTAFTSFIKDALGMVIVVYFIQNPGALRRSVWALLLAGLLMGTISVYQYATSNYFNNFWGLGGWESQVSGEISRYRLSGPYGNPNAYAQVLVVLAPLALDRVWHERNFWLRLIAAWVLTVVVLTTFFTYSRGGFLALVFAISVLLTQRRFNFFPVIVTAAVALALVQFLPATYTDRINSLVQLVPSQNNQVVDTSFLGRLSENTVAWRMFQNYPVFGVGLGNFSVLYQDYSRELGIDQRRASRSPASLYLELLSEQGLVGTIIFMLLMVYVFRGLVLARRHFVIAKLKDESYLVSAVFAGLAGYMFEAIFKNSAYSNVFWILVGVALGAIQVAQASYEKVAEDEQALTGQIA